METRRVLRLFLASPGDVASERTIVRDVVNEWNLAVGQKRGLQVDVIGWETHVAPDYGSDPQSIINRQIGDMKRCALFVGILKHRFGTATPREPSGTIEEFKRAERVHKLNGKLRIMMYFSSANMPTPNESALEQKSKVLAFKKRIEPLSIYQPYRTREDFRKLFSRHFHGWVSDWLETLPASAKARSTKAAKPKTPITKPKSCPVNNSIALRPSKAKSKITSKLTPTKKVSLKAPSKAPARRGPATVSTSGPRLLLDGRVYDCRPVRGNSNQITLEIVTRSGEDESVLRGLCDTRSYHPLSYAHGRDAGQFRLDSHESQSNGRNILWTLRGTINRPNGSGWMTPDESEKRIRALLLGSPPAGVKSQHSVWGSGIGNATHRSTPAPTLLAALWKEMTGKRDRFLYVAWLHAIYNLKKDGLCDDIHDLKLGPITGNKMRVHFKGRVRSAYSNATHTIEFTGNCSLLSGK